MKVSCVFWECGSWRSYSKYFDSQHGGLGSIWVLDVFLLCQALILSLPHHRDSRGESSKWGSSRTCDSHYLQAGTGEHQCFRPPRPLTGARQLDRVPDGACMLSGSGMSDPLGPRGLQPTRLVGTWDSPGKNTRVGCRALLQGIFPTQGIEPVSLGSPALASGFFTSSTT